MLVSTLLLYWLGIPVPAKKLFCRTTFLCEPPLSIFPSLNCCVLSASANRFCRPIMTKPKPAPAKPATPETPQAPPPQGSEQQPEGGDANPSANNANSSPENAAAESAEEPLASNEPMETDKPEPGPTSA